jgi:hypothetical protein
MKKHSVDLRKYTRVFFGIKNHVDGMVSVDSERQVSVRFINLSAGIVLNPKRAGMLSFLDNTECEVRYMLTVECIPLATIGCQFMKLPDTALDQVRKIVESRLGERDDGSGANPG